MHGHWARNYSWYVVWWIRLLGVKRSQSNLTKRLEHAVYWYLNNLLRAGNATAVDGFGDGSVTLFNLHENLWPMCWWGRESSIEPYRPRKHGLRRVNWPSPRFQWESRNAVWSPIFTELGEPNYTIFGDSNMCSFSKSVRLIETG